MQDNIKMWHVLVWSLKKCGSFLKCVVLFSKTGILVEMCRISQMKDAMKTCFTMINISTNTTFEQTMVDFSVNWLYKVFHQANIWFSFE